MEDKHLKTGAIADILISNWEIYAKYIIQSRALPDIRDGLKPVHRRILWTMVQPDVNARSTTQPVKSAKISGSCFVEGELISTDTGLKKIEKLEIGDQTRLPDGSTTTVVACYKNPPLPIIEVTFSDGYTMQVTEDHEFKVLNENLEFTMCRADQLQGKKVLTSKGQHDLYKPNPRDTDIAYQEGLYFTRYGQHTSINYYEGRKQNWKNTYYLTSYGKEAVAVLHDVCRCHNYQREVPDCILNNRYRYPAFLAGYMDGDGHIRKNKKAWKITLGTVSEVGANQLHAILSDLGIRAKIQTVVSTKKNYKDKKTIVISGTNAAVLAEIILPYLKIPRKINAVKKIRYHKNQIGSSLYPKLQNIVDMYNILDVVSITKLPTPKESYDVQVKDDSHLLLAHSIVTSNCIGNYHPHGDQAVYEAMVRLTQPWVMNKTLVEGKGNFGSIDGDSAAANRYTEARLSKFADNVFFYRKLRMEENIVPFIPNYDNTKYEPIVFPALLPNLLINGSSGLVVGMKTEIPPFNISEICDALVSILDGKDSLPEIMKVLPAPDFPTGGLVEANTEEIKKLYTIGKAKLQIRGKIYINTNEHGVNLVINQIPYGIRKETLVEELYTKTQGTIKTIKDPRTGKKKEEKIEAEIRGVTDIVDLSGGDNGPVHIEMRVSAGYDPNSVANLLFKKTSLQQSINPNIIVIDNYKPVNTGIIGVLHSFLKFREETVIREFVYDRDNAAARLHILEGRLSANTNIDRVINIIKNNIPDKQKNILKKEFKLSDRQVEDIRALPLSSISKLEISKIEKEKKEKEEFINYANQILNNTKERRKYIKDQILKLQAELSTKRKTEISSEFEEIKDLDTVTKQEVVLIVNSNNTIKTTPVDEYRIQKKGGKGVAGVGDNKEIQVKYLGQVSTHNTVWIITDLGNRYILPIHLVRPTKKQSSPKNITDFIPNFREDENIIGAIVITDEDAVHPDRYLVVLNELGLIKKMALPDLLSKRATTTRIFPAEESGYLVAAKLMDGENDVFITSKYGQGLRFGLDKLRTVQSLDAGGVASITLFEDDSIVGCSCIKPDDMLIFVSELGFAKRVPEEDIPRIRGRVGQGSKVNPDNAGGLVLAETIYGDQLIAITNTGKAIRIDINDIGTFRRIARGQRIQKLGGSEIVSAATQIDTNAVTG